MIGEGGGTWRSDGAREKAGLDWQGGDESSGASCDNFCSAEYGSPDKSTRWKTERVFRKKGNEWNGPLEIGRRMIEER